VSGSIVAITKENLIGKASLCGKLLALNNAYAQELSWLEPERLTQLLAEAFLATRIGEVDGMLIALDQDADYDSPNFLWFRSRFPRFVYVDRVVVAPEARGRGHARRLYQDLFNHAARAGHDKIVCEVNSNPPNPESDAFHVALGFTELATGSIHGGLKTVRYLVRQLSLEVSPTI
jgi:predicted GNAT superfamily acetyltransferase